jgi:hypothetical protein
MILCKSLHPSKNENEYQTHNGLKMRVPNRKFDAIGNELMITNLYTFVNRSRRMPRAFVFWISAQTFVYCCLPRKAEERHPNPRRRLMLVLRLGSPIDMT